MKKNSSRGIGPFHSVAEEVQRDTRNTLELAFLDKNFLLNEHNRSIRLMLEYLKPETILMSENIHSTIVVFGSARLDSPEKAQKKLSQIEQKIQHNTETPKLKAELERAKKNLTRSEFYVLAQEFTKIVAEQSVKYGPGHNIIITGGGGGIMEAANRGAYESGMKSIGLNILLPKEQEPNPFITDNLNFRFHYFAIRKMHLLVRARALVFFPGGYGTLDELFEALTLLQTTKISPVPVILFNQKYWQSLINFQLLVDEEYISPEDLDFFRYAETPEQGWDIIERHYQTHSF